MKIILWKVVCVVCILFLNATGSLSQLRVCGQAPLNNKIVGGQNAALGSWPWQVIVQSANTLCGGSLINQNWVLTAAHCLKVNGIAFTARQITVSRRLENGIVMKTINAIKLIIHKGYNDETLVNDIALVQLSSSVQFNDYFRPVSLAASNSSFPSGTNVWATGWGRISNNNLQLAQKLQEVKLQIVSNSDCAQKYSPFIITDGMMCAISPVGGQDICQGDSGGPLMVNFNGSWIQGGIVSFTSGRGCASPSIPSGYTRVSQYEDWINNTGNNQPEFVAFSFGSYISLNLFCLFLSFTIIPFILPSLSIY
ncbi:chymotrypsinogen B-like isoform X2 [Tachysurus fulvidraco]|uniref:chymotrypsinogen B-like isoform X2 n=1 Tax=Tachysurus fulvidraco TaxID=1234273 RepID=UPI001FEDD104|nr:chymotrypsinogen B-like isoform X2 [Tachysurus fulvidraco]